MPIKLGVVAINTQPADFTWLKNYIWFYQNAQFVETK
jgi:hypothetical protein